MIRSLLVDDCIDAGKEFNAGGARYNWSVVNVGGLANVADSLAAIRELLYEQAMVSPSELLGAMRRNFAGDEGLRQAIRAAPSSATTTTAWTLWRAMWGISCWRRIRATRAGAAGIFSRLPAVRDVRGSGREPAGQPRRPRRGRGHCRLDRPASGSRPQRPDRDAQVGGQARPRGWPGHARVLNLRLAAGMFQGAAGRQAVIDLVRGFFDLGGMQLQVSVIDQDVLRDAMAHPDRHENLIVRIGGYSEYFNRLGPDLQRTVLERTEHQVVH